jgi:hypothetical protein
MSKSGRPGLQSRPATARRQGDRDGNKECRGGFVTFDHPSPSRRCGGAPVVWWGMAKSKGRDGGELCRPAWSAREHARRTDFDSLAESFTIRNPLASGVTSRFQDRGSRRQECRCGAGIEPAETQTWLAQIPASCATTRQAWLPLYFPTSIGPCCLASRAGYRNFLVAVKALRYLCGLLFKPSVSGNPPNPF